MAEQPCSPGTNSTSRNPSILFERGSSSPYEDAESSAEVGEPLFEELQALLTPAPPDESAASSSRSRRRNNGMEKPTQQAIEKLGYETAHAMVNARAQIAWSGIVYSPEWPATKHIRGGVPIPVLNPSMILLCLREDRLFRANAIVLARLSKDLGVTGIVHEAMDFWKLNKKFPRLSSTPDLSTIYSFDRYHLLTCFKCAIFVARTFEAMTLLEIRNDEVIRPKVLACLRTMEQNLIIVDTDTEDESRDTTTDMRRHPVEQLDLRTGKVPATFPSLKGAGDLVVVRAGSDAQPRKRKRPSSTVVAIEQVCLKTGKVLGTFPSAAEATSIVGGADISRRSRIIHAVLAGRSKSAFGYFWRKRGSERLPHGLGEPANSSADEEDYDDCQHEQEENDDGSLSDELQSRKNTPNVYQRQQPVEQLDIKTGKVLATFPSMKKAADYVGTTVQNIQKTVYGRNVSASGYFWRRVGSDEKPREKKPSVPVAVEQICLKSGKVLGTFRNTSDATSTVGGSDINRKSRTIHEVLDGRSKSAFGYFWRKRGSERLPHGLGEPANSSADEEDYDDCQHEQEEDADDDGSLSDGPPSRKNTPKNREHWQPVEQLDIKTGKVLATFPSMKKAADYVGTTVQNIQKTLYGRNVSASGYFWRRVGSDEKPREKKPSVPVAVEQICLTSGKVLGTFQNTAEATSTVGGSDVNRKSRNIHEVLAGRSNAAFGYFWRKLESERLPHGFVEPVNSSADEEDYDDCQHEQEEDADDDGSLSDGPQSRKNTPKNREHWQPVEQLDIKTGKVLATFPSIKGAADYVGTAKQSIQSVIYGKNITSVGYFWRRVGSDEQPRKRKLSPGVAVEQVCLKTGKVLATFPSTSEATSSVGGSDVNRKSRNIHAVLDGRSESAFGYFWRKRGSARLPHGFVEPANSSADEEDYDDGQDEQEEEDEEDDGSLSDETPSRKNTAKVYQRREPVEQLDIKTGKVLATFHSITAAGKAVGVAHQSIQQVIYGTQNVAAGYFWRRVGSDEKPRKKKLSANAVAVEQVCMKTGKVLGTFPSLSEAHASVAGPNAIRKRKGNSHNINQVVAGRSQSAFGYYWRKIGSKRVPYCLRPDYKQPHQSLSVPVEQLDLSTGEVLWKFSSIEKASKSAGVSRNSIRSVMDGMKESAGGYYWRVVGSRNLPDSSNQRGRVQVSPRKSAAKRLAVDHTPSEQAASDDNNNNNRANDRLARPRKRARGVVVVAVNTQKRNNAEYWARLAEKQCRQTHRTFKELRRAVLSTRVGRGT